MPNIYIVLDATMCILWIATYIFVLVGTVKYRKPLISPISQLCYSTNEFSALLFFIASASVFDYVDIAYISWALIEIAIFIALIKNGVVRKQYIIKYISVVLIVTLFLFYLIYKGHMLFICYFNAFTGGIFWLKFICKKDYPMKPIALVAFLLKFFADLIAVPVYIGDGGAVIDLMCLMLPVLDFIFIGKYLKTKICEKTYS